MIRFHTIVVTVLLIVGVARGQFQFKLHEIGSPGGRAFGQTTLVDIDGDGDLDFISGQRGGKVFWHEFIAPGDPGNPGNPGKWATHVIGSGATTDVGGCAFDIDGDGDVDQASGAVWFRNPGKGRMKEQWQRFESGAISTHDNFAADIDGDGRLDLVAMSDQAGVFWYRIPKDATQKWTGTRIGDARHSGIAIGDIDGDGDNDIVRADVWFENRDGKGAQWKTHDNIPFPGKKYNFAGMATQTRLGDIDGDGDLDIAMTDGEVKDARASWLENVDGKGGQWKRYDLTKDDKGAMHSVALADFDNDGDLDIFSCEMGIGGGGRWFIWENPAPGSKDRDKARSLPWKEHIILENVLGHESRVGDVDGDGDIDICSKPWNGDRHVFVENLLRKR